jgi:hypothetical protein
MTFDVFSRCAPQHADASALGEVLGVGALKRVRGVEGLLTPGRFT